MADDFDLKELADYLHLDLTTVRRMAERGRIPGRRSGTDWRFHPAEIHHWLESRIVESDPEERDRLSKALERQAAPDEGGDLSLDALLPLEAVEVPLAARTKNSVIEGMIGVAVRTGLLWDPPKMEDAVRQREELYPTAIDGGVALLHPRRPMASILGGPLLALGRTDAGVPFGDPHGGLTDLFFLILSMDDAGHLRTLARLSRLLRPELLDDLRAAPDAASVRNVLVEADRAG